MPDRALLRAFAFSVTIGTMETARAKAKRSPGTGRTQVRSIRFDPVDLERIRKLARRWECSEAAAVRKAIADAIEAADREDERKLAYKEMSRAAHQMLEYYSTDPEALEMADFVGDDLHETR